MNVENTENEVMLGKGTLQIVLTKKSEYIYCQYKEVIKDLSDKGFFPSIESTWHMEDGKLILITGIKNFTRTFVYEWTYHMLADAANMILSVNEILKSYGLTLTTFNPYRGIDFIDGKPMIINFIFGEGRIKIKNVDTLYEYYVWPLISLNKNSSIVRNILKSNQNEIFRVEDLENIYSGLSGTKMRSFREKALRHLPEQARDWSVKSRYHKYIGIIKSSNKKMPMNEDWSDYLPGDIQLTDDSRIYEIHPRYRRIIEIMKELNIRSVLEFGGNRGLFAGLVCSKLEIDNYFCTDYDEVSIDWLYMQTKGRENNEIHPLTINFEDGYKANELGIISDRIQAEAVVAMALTHHLLLRQHINIDTMFDVMYCCTKQFLVVEFMPMGLWDGKNRTPETPVYYNKMWFRKHMEKRFKIIIEEEMKEPNRLLFIGQKI